MKSLTEYLWFKVPGQRGLINITLTVGEPVSRSGVAGKPMHRSRRGGTREGITTSFIHLRSYSLYQPDKLRDPVHCANNQLQSPSAEDDG